MTKRNSDLHITVQVYGGAHIPRVIEEMVDLANRMQISVWAELNGVRTLARVGEDPVAIYRAWEEAIDKKRGYASA